jgi:hypothetical protein
MLPMDSFFTLGNVPALLEADFVRLASVLASNGNLLEPRSIWWADVKSGHFSQSVKLGQRTTFGFIEKAK